MTQVRAQLATFLKCDGCFLLVLVLDFIGFDYEDEDDWVAALPRWVLPCPSVVKIFARFAPFGGKGQQGSNEWCFFGKKRDGFHIPLIYCDFRVVEGRNVLMKPAGITAIFYDPKPLNL